jgi:argininosuccinate lyase
MMPQKQNPDFLELTRAGAGKLIGALNGLLSVCKGLPSGYNRDLQMDKEYLFDAVETVPLTLHVLAEGFQGLAIQRRRIAEALQDESLYATDCVEYLVAKGVPFAQAHRAVGEMMGTCRRGHTQPSNLPLKTIQRFSPLFGKDVYRLFDPAASVARKRSYGSTNPLRVGREIRKWKASLRRKNPSHHPGTMPHASL